jgi:signal transduction histidine kinase
VTTHATPRSTTPLRRVVGPLAVAKTYGALLYYLAELGLGVVGFALLIVGWTVTLVLAITPLVVPVLIGFRAAVGGLAQAEAFLARNLIGASAHPRASSNGSGFWSRGFSVLKDESFWKQQAHLFVSWPIALIPLALLGWGGQFLSVPIWYRWADSNDVVGLFNIDSLKRALPLAAAGAIVLVVLAHLLGPMSSLSRRLADSLLASDAEAMATTEAERRVRRLRALTIDSLISSGIVLLLVVIWALTGGGYFWPIWPLLALTLVVAIPGWIVLVLERRDVARFTLGSEALAVHLGISALLLAFLVGIWAAAGGGYFWPVWPALGLALLVVVHAAVVYAQREHRIERLEETRAGAVDVQEAELRRIERDLHDGAQARLVALGMNLGLAEQALQTDPAAAAELLAEARRGAGEALEELRVIARGIRPPILTDRGLEPAVAALTAHTPLTVEVSVDVPGRYPSAIETAAYFTVAEALANAIKHGNADRVDIRIAAVDGRLVVEVVDDGDGGADPSGPGLTGLRQRAEALDGTLRVESPAGGPTTVSAELPCVSS